MTPSEELTQPHYCRTCIHLYIVPRSECHRFPPQYAPQDPDVREADHYSWPFAFPIVDPDRDFCGEWRGEDVDPETET